MPPTYSPRSRWMSRIWGPALTPPAPARSASCRTGRGWACMEAGASSAGPSSARTSHAAAPATSRSRGHCLTTSVRAVSPQCPAYPRCRCRWKARSATAWQFDGVRVGLGRASLALDGRIGGEINLRFAVNAEDLSLLSADSRGQLKATGTIRGTLADPTIAATAHGAGIHYDGITLEGFDADIDFDPRPQRDSRIEARLRNLTYRDRLFQSVVFTLGGEAADYAAHLEVKTIGLSATAQASGPYAHGVFQGQLGTLTLNGSQSLHLELERPVGLLVSAAAARIEWLCLVGTPASLCADGDWSPGQWSATLTANQLPINTLTSGLTPSVEYQATINI